MTGDLASARLASDADLSVILRLASLGVEELRGERGGELLLFHDMHDVAEPGRYDVGLGDERSCLAVGLVDGVPVGYALAGLSRPIQPALCMIHELFVHPDARGVGVGAELLALVRGWGVDQGCRAIESQVLPGNRAAKNFFERVGMVTRKMQVSTDL